MQKETKRPPLHIKRKFALGRIMVTPAALHVLSIVEMDNALQRHCRGDWGDVCSEDWEANDLALSERHRVLSVYQSTAQEVFWIITEWDRSLTTILLPSDY